MNMNQTFSTLLHRSMSNDNILVPSRHNPPTHWVPTGNLDFWLSIPSSQSFINGMKSWGPNTDPWEKPPTIFCQLEHRLIPTVCLLLLHSFLTHINRLSPILSTLFVVMKAPSLSSELNPLIPQHKWDTFLQPLSRSTTITLGIQLGETPGNFTPNRERAEIVTVTKRSEKYK